MQSFIELSKRALESNFDQFRNFLPKNKKIISVVKANAYGHGIKEVVNVLKNKTDYFGVNRMDEALTVRSLTDKPILLMGYFDDSDAKVIIENNIEAVIYNESKASVLNSLAQATGVHSKVWIKVDALLGRQGVLLEKLEEFLSEINNFSNLDILGFYGHFSNLEDTNDLGQSERQLAIMDRAKEIFQKYGLPASFHISASGGAMIYPNIGDFVRIGIGLYGIWPSAEMEKQFREKINLEPVLRWVSRLAQVKIVPQNFPIGYGDTYKTDRETKIGIVPVGYSDGFDRKLSNRGFVLVQGKKARVLGRVAMNMFAIDLSEIPDVKENDEVVLIGVQGNEKITTEDIAVTTDTINYEVVARLSSSLPRVLITD